MSGGSPVTGRVHVLLVEDDPSVAEMYRVRLEMDGYRVLVAPDGVTGLGLVREMAPELVLLDSRLPRLDGAGVLRALRADERTREQAVVMLSAYDEPRLVQEGLGLGALEWLVKSHVTPSELSGVVGRFVTLEPTPSL
ncbi:MAG TPA: response regulator [Candidatus Dormibacteraeota bacterium]|nr:response regulator [Candidatus Dormibacteraeota bacterium]